MTQRISRYAAIIAVAAGLLIPGVMASPALAQIPAPGSGLLLPPPPAPPPPPRIVVPVVPQLDAIPSQPTAPVTSSRSFGDRITSCLADAAAAGYGPEERATYSRACANR
jgi:hypothetical protein